MFCSSCKELIKKLSKTWLKLPEDFCRRRRKSKLLHESCRLVKHLLPEVYGGANKPQEGRGTLPPPADALLQLSTPKIRLRIQLGARHLRMERTGATLSISVGDIAAWHFVTTIAAEPSLLSCSGTWFDPWLAARSAHLVHCMLL